MQTSNADNLFRTSEAVEEEQARARKAARNKDIGEPIPVASKIIKAVIRGNAAWTAESAHIARKVDLETGRTLQIFKGHTGPVTCLAFYELPISDGTVKTLLITGSWDKTIKIWDTSSKQVICDTPAHGDFAKALLVIPSKKILVSSSSDRTVKLWDLSLLVASSATTGLQKPLHELASISGHRRPVEALACSDDLPITLLTADSMGVIKVWSLEDRWRSSPGSLPTVKATHKGDIAVHSTGVNDLYLKSGYLWTASTDQSATLQLHPQPPHPAAAATQNVSQKLDHRDPVRCLLVLAHINNSSMPYLLTGSGDVLRLYDVEDLVKDPNDDDDDDDDDQDPSTKLLKGKPRLLCEVDVHSQPVTALGLWSKTVDGREEPWIVSASLDGTLRRWKLSDLVAGKVPKPGYTPYAEDVPPTTHDELSTLTKEEERELAELMEDD